MAGIKPAHGSRGMRKKWPRIVLRQRVFVITLLLIQLGFLLYLIAGSGRIFRYAGVGLNIVSVMVCLYILNKKEKPAFKLTWIFLILMFPIFGGLLYIFFYTQSNPKKLRALIKADRQKTMPLYLLPGNVLPLLDKSGEPCLPQVRYLQEYMGFPVYVHTQSEYFDSGEKFFKKALEELEKAERYIFMEFFILSQGIMLDPIIALLERKAKAGLDIRLIYDDMGCFMTLPPDYQRHLERRGIKCIVFNPFKPILSSLQNNRDHRKIISIDGKAAFTGGINLADEYINAIEKYGHWKDAAIMISGEAALSLTLIFLQMWNMGKTQKEDYASFYPWKDGPCTVPSDGYVQPYADTPIDQENVGEHVYIQIINNAKKYVYINTPYLIVDDNLISALTLSAKSGVDVRIITPHRWDKKLVHMTTRSYYRQLVSAGVKVYEYSSGFNHSKTFVSDDKVATVGTMNLDFRSLYLHYECGIWLYKTRAVQGVKEDFLRTMAVSRKITPEECERNAVMRIIPDILRLFAPLM
ncbi:MAG: cardiolipin synthase [Spirochaetaceae bacterium]|jgi:cardiolipin synthase|nr:cardiolipin synthase [Spirochaetaceae bacterium]